MEEYLFLFLKFAFLGKKDLVSRLLKNGVFVDQKDHENRTATVLAVQNGNLVNLFKKTKSTHLYNEFDAIYVESR